MTLHLYPLLRSIRVVMMHNKPESRINRESVKGSCVCIVLQAEHAYASIVIYGGQAKWVMRQWCRG